MKRRDVYMNKMQQRIFYSCARDVRLLASRRFGKTDGCIGPRIVTVSSALPRATCIWLGNSRKQLYTRTVPGTIAAIERFYNMREGVHFGWGRIPSKYPQPIIKPKSWENVIWFANGTIWQLVSMAVEGSANGITSSSIVGDECKYLNKKKLDEEVMPTLSGGIHPQGDERFTDSNPLYKSTFFASDASITARGNWLEKDEEKLELLIESGKLAGKSYAQVQQWLTHYADAVIFYNELLRDAAREGFSVRVLPKEQVEAVKLKAQMLINREGIFSIIKGTGITKAVLNDCIKYKLIDAEEAELLHGHRYLITIEQDFKMNQIMRSTSFRKQLQEYQRNAFCFYRANALDNIDILTPEYIARMKRDLSPLLFQISILNKKVAKINNGYYHKLDIENIHGYIPDSCPAIDLAYTNKIATETIGGTNYEHEYSTVDFNRLGLVHDCTLDGDVMPGQPLLIAGDWNAKLYWFVCGQRYNRDGSDTLNVLSSFFAKNDRNLYDLCADFHRYYRPHQSTCRDIKFFFDSTAKYLEVDFKKTEPFAVVISELSRYGWNVIPVDMGNPMSHKKKYYEINYALEGRLAPAIRINRDNNESLIIALESADVKMGKNGFEKDKSGEKLSEDTDNAVRLELRTDATDAFDSLWIGCAHYYNNLAGMCMPY